MGCLIDRFVSDEFGNTVSDWTVLLSGAAKVGVCHVLGRGVMMKPVHDIAHDM